MAGAIVNDIKAIQKAKEATMGDISGDDDYKKKFRAQLFNDMNKRIPPSKITKMKVIPRNY